MTVSKENEITRTIKEINKLRRWITLPSHQILFVDLNGVCGIRTKTLVGFRAQYQYDLCPTMLSFLRSLSTQVLVIFYTCMSFQNARAMVEQTELRHINHVIFHQIFCYPSKSDESEIMAWKNKINLIISNNDRQVIKALSSGYQQMSQHYSKINSSFSFSKDPIFLCDQLNIKKDNCFCIDDSAEKFSKIDAMINIIPSFTGLLDQKREQIIEETIEKMRLKFNELATLAKPEDDFIVIRKSLSLYIVIFSVILLIWPMRRSLHK